MNQLIQFKTTTLSFLIAFLLSCVALLPKVQALAPPADGGYAGENTAEGTGALNSFSPQFRGFGVDNTALGFHALYSDTGASYNTATGAFALRSNTSGPGNTATGYEALQSNTSGFGNTATGYQALDSNTIGLGNTAIGYQAAFSNVGAIEAETLGGSYNTTTGFEALYSNTDGSRNTANGSQALFSNIHGEDNTATGYHALYNNVGVNDFPPFILGRWNTATGSSALENNSDGSDNTGIGYLALYSNTTGEFNTAVGALALGHNKTGSSNVAVGGAAGLNLTAGDGNVVIGEDAGANLTGDGNVCIGYSILGVAGESNQTWIRNINTTGQTFSAGVNNYVTVRMSDGRLGYTAVVSSRRYKEDIKPLDKTSEALYALKPVSFRLKKEFDPTQALGFGLIGEEVEKVNPALVYRNETGQVESVRYEMVNAMLLNEFLKEHRMVQQQQKEIDALKAELKEQRALIQKVNDKVELGKPAPRTILNSQ
jgi:trimeric autotransporter adhesin